MRYLDKGKGASYLESIRIVLEESKQLAGGSLRVERKLFNTTVHRTSSTASRP